MSSIFDLILYSPAKILQELKDADVRKNDYELLTELIETSKLDRESQQIANNDFFLIHLIDSEDSLISQVEELGISSLNMSRMLIVIFLTVIAIDDKELTLYLLKHIKPYILLSLIGSIIMNEDLFDYLRRYLRGTYLYHLINIEGESCGYEKPDIDFTENYIIATLLVKYSDVWTIPEIYLINREFNRAIDDNMKTLISMHDLPTTIRTPFQLRQYKPVITIVNNQTVESIHNLSTTISTQFQLQPHKSRIAKDKTLESTYNHKYSWSLF